MSDSDAAFQGNNRDEDQNFQKILSNNNAVLEPVMRYIDHHALGVILIKVMVIYYVSLISSAVKYGHFL